MLNIDYRDGRPIYEQIADGFARLAISGALAPDTQMPSVRQLAMELSINPNTIQRAYNELEKRGVIYSIKGRGSFVSSDCNTLRSTRLEEIHTEMDKLTQEAKQLGASQETITQWMIDGYQKGEKQT